MSTISSPRDVPLPLESTTVSRSTTLNVADEADIDAAFALKGADLNADDDLIHWEVLLLLPYIPDCIATNTSMSSLA